MQDNSGWGMAPSYLLSQSTKVLLMGKSYLSQLFNVPFTVTIDV